MASPPILTPDQRLRVFVSSTLHELAQEREAVRDAVTRMRLVPVMFESGARPHPPGDVYRAYVARSQVFVGVYGDSYGWQAPGAPVSGLEDEYRIAGDLDLPRLIYLRRPARDRDPRLAAMIDDIRSRADVSYRGFSDATELRELVERDLAVLLSERFERGRPEPAAEPAAVPAPRSPMIGRDAEIAALTELLTDDRVPLVTLTGPGGVGKTRLAAELGDRLRDRFADGVTYAELSAVTRPELVGEALARSLGLRTSGEGAPVDELADFLRPKRLLLIVDNFEQVVDAAPVLGRLLGAAPGVTALITSRAQLRISGERAYAVPPLASDGAVRMFAERAAAAGRTLDLTGTDLDVVAEICRRLDGLPLAIELAAARVRVLPLTAIRDRLDQPLDLLTRGARDLPARQRTLRATIAWSYQLLSPAEQRLLDRLAVFSGGFDTAAAEAVGGAGALDVLEGLLENSLVAAVPGTYRCGMLDSIRTYALERLAEGGDGPAARRAHADYFFDLARKAEVELSGPAAREWIRLLAADHDNIATAMSWYLDNDQPEQTLTMGMAMWVYWWLHGPFEQARRFVDQVDAVRDRLPAVVRARALLASGSIMLITGDVPAGRDRLETARPMLRAAGDDLSFVRASGTLSLAAIREHDFAAARELLEEAREISERLGDATQISLSYSRLGTVALAEGDLDRAREQVTAALAAAAAGEAVLAQIVALYSLAVTAVRGADVEGARRFLHDGLAVAHENGDVNTTRLFVAAIADIAAREGDLERAVRLAAGAAAIQQPSGTNWMDIYVPRWPAYLPLDPSRFDRAHREGAALSLADVVTEALRS